MCPFACLGAVSPTATPIQVPYSSMHSPSPPPVRIVPGPALAPIYHMQISIDDQTPLNGCIRGVWPRHQCPDQDDGLLPPTAGGDPDLDGRAGGIAADIAAALPWQDVPTTAGSLVLFNHWFPHCSERNDSDAIRRAAFFLFNPASQGDQHAAHLAHVQGARAAWRQQALDYEADAAAALRAGVAL